MGEKNKTTVKDVDSKLQESFKRIKSDIFNLKKSKKMLNKDLNNLNLRHVSFEKDVVYKDELRNVSLRVGGLEKDSKLMKEINKDFKIFKEDSVREKEFNKSKKVTDYEINKLNKRLDRVSNNKNNSNKKRLKEIEDKILDESKIKTVVSSELKRNYLTVDQTVKEIENVKKEYIKLYSKISKIKKEVLNFQKTKFFANTLLLLSIVNLVGSAIGIHFKYTDAANFLGIEALVFFAAALLIHLYVVLRR
ncbi:hypothetical protein KY321_00680 [Candidatus Woesearchaeota archaeon]|nr:hypothetical protein [Candidatus Woesearchaeota archaeon]